MSFTSRLVHWLLRLPPAETHDIVITRDLRVPMPDGVNLLADHYMPRTGPKRPTILVRSPYGRRGPLGAFAVLPYVVQGYQVVIQSCRGTAGSGGTFAFARHEHDDGLATVAWIKQQSWFSGDLATLGASYLGFVQWAVAADVKPELKAMVLQVTSADFNHFRFQGGSFNLETSLNWSTMMTVQAATGMRLRSLPGAMRRERRLEQAYLHLPLGEADQATIGQHSRPFQQHITHGPDDEYWQPVDYSARIAEINTPIYLMGGWYDLFLDWQLNDYLALRAAGHQPYLLIGPWTHTEAAGSRVIAQESLTWLNAHVKGKRQGLREQPVRLFIMGSKEWRDFADWPPPVEQERWYLHDGNELASTPPTDSEPDRYRYDPSDPTPAVGGNSLGADKHMGAKDNRALEARSDVLVYTSAALGQDVELIGPVTADLYVRSSLEHTDFFARLCVVEVSGRSTNLCDGIVRLTPGSIMPESDGSLHIAIRLWPTAHHFRKGERIRVQVSSGAHPRFVRNLGTGEPLATGNKLCVAEQEVFHDPAHPSAFVLPVHQRT